MDPFGRRSFLHTVLTNSVFSARWRKIKWKLNSAYKIKSCQTSEQQKQPCVVGETSAARLRLTITVIIHQSADYLQHWSNICSVTISLKWRLQTPHSLSGTTKKSCKESETRQCLAWNDWQRYSLQWTGQNQSSDVKLNSCKLMPSDSQE